MRSCEGGLNIKECIATHSNCIIKSLDFTEISLVRSFASVTLLEGNAVTLSCTPSIMEIGLSWAHNGTVVNGDENINFFPVNLNHNLTINNAGVEDSGLYACRVVLGDKVIEQNISVTVLAGMYRYNYVLLFVSASKCLKKLMIIEN